MQFLQLIWTNLRRHRGRSLIGCAGIAFGVAAMVSILAVVSGAIGMFEHLLATDNDYLVFEKNASDLFFSSVKSAEVDRIAALPQVVSATPILFGIVSSPGHPVLTCFGLTEADPRLTRATWRSGNPKEFGLKPGRIYLGTRAAEFLHAALGQTIEIGPTHFSVGGILKLENGFEDGGAFLPLKEAQDYFQRSDTVSVVAVKLHRTKDGASFKAAVDQNLPRLEAMQNREFDRSYNSFRILRATSWAVGAAAFLLGGLGVANTMLMSVFGRIREFAILQVCGFSKTQLKLLVLGEALTMAVLGLLAGGLLSAALLYILPHLSVLQGYVQARVQLPVLFGVVALSLITASLGALYPARLASRIQPADALRYE